LFDIGVASVALLLLTPLLLGLALWIKATSPGPVLFHQERAGRHGKPFFIHKLRTMRHGASGGLLTVGEDTRITSVGRLLRHTRLDELPQLVNVLKGDMSLVGPRPEVPRYVAHYPAHLRERALSVRPGITDPASLHFLDEAKLLAAAPDPEHTYIHSILPTKVAMAAAYAERATLASDMAVLWRTLKMLVSSRQAP
jgi:lipopolysaccharide/colanic/teichoic acid biosynthesis glycosyltransferase